MKRIASSFGITESGSRAGVITFSYNVENSIKLNDHFDISSFGNSVDNIPLMGHTTRIDKALRLAQKVLIHKFVSQLILHSISYCRSLVYKYIILPIRPPSVRF